MRGKTHRNRKRNTVTSSIKLPKHLISWFLVQCVHIGKRLAIVEKRYYIVRNVGQTETKDERTCQQSENLLTSLVNNANFVRIKSKF